MSRALEQIRWTVERASSEFGIDRRTLAKRLVVGGIEPGTDGKFSTAQICDARFGDREQRETEKVGKENEFLDVKIGKAKGSLIELAVAEARWEEIIIVAKTRLANLPSKLESRLGLSEWQTKQAEAEVDEVLNDLSKPPDYQSARAEEADGEDG